MLIKFKYNSIYIIYYILILLKSLFIIYLNNYKYIHYIYIYILFIYFNLLYLYKFKNLYNNNCIITSNYIYFYLYKYLKLKFLNNEKINLIKLINKSYKFIEKIIMIKKVSYTIQKGRIKRYKVLMVIGNKNGWIGIGYGKNSSLNKAIKSAKLNAISNIYYFKYSILHIYKLKCIYFKTSFIFGKVQSMIYNCMNIKFLLFKYLLECLGYLNYKLILYHNRIQNKYNLIHILLSTLFNIF